MADSSFYFSVLYPFQDDVLRLVKEAKTGFHLTGGTALSRGYLQHRFSDDLDMFVNFDAHFGEWSNRVVDTFWRLGDWTTEVILREEFFVRAVLTRGEVMLKVEMVNDVGSRVGDVRDHPVLGRLDSAENILANKLTALIGRDESRDLADVWGLCTTLGLSINDAIFGKSSGIYPVDLARRLYSATREDWDAVSWIEPAPDPERYLSALRALGEQLILPDTYRGIGNP
jgi:nucleotidyltransferase AbiEii toxin of type IV toxin-antitoxin system